MGHTGISYATKGWPVVIGCSRASPGCDNCWSARLASTRLAHIPRYSGLAKDRRWTGEVRLQHDLLDEPTRWSKPQRVFVCQTADLFHEKVPDGFIEMVFRVMGDCPRHLFLVLTKRVKRMALLAANLPVLHNVLLGATMENQRAADERMMDLDGIAQRGWRTWISMEPLLERTLVECCLPGAEWVVAGGETGRKARLCDLDWLRLVRDECSELGAKFYLKQIGGDLGGTALDGKRYLEVPPVRPSVYSNNRKRA